MGKFHEFEIPGEDLVLKGLEDLTNGVESIESLLVLVGTPRLRGLGFQVPDQTFREFPEERLYRLIEKLDAENAHAQYNAYVRRLVSFENSMEVMGLRNSAKPESGGPSSLR